MGRWSLRHWARSGLARLAGHYGYDLRAKGQPPRGFAGLLAFAERRGLAPGTVFDVGVGPGTPWLYGAFPAAKLVLIEPLRLFDQSLEAICRQHDADYHRVALSNHSGVASIRIPASVPTGASLKSRRPGFVPANRPPGEERHEEVQLRRLDEIGGYPPPYLLKLDTEGAERDVLEGAERTLREVDLLILETSVLPRHEDEPSFAELVAFLDERGFRLLDIPCLSQAGREGPLVFIDLAFVRKDDGRWL